MELQSITNYYVFYILFSFPEILWYYLFVVYYYVYKENLGMKSLQTNCRKIYIFFNLKKECDCLSSKKYSEHLNF